MSNEDILSDWEKYKRKVQTRKTKYKPIKDSKALSRKYPATYVAYMSMLYRCAKPTHAMYRNYGAKGVGVWDEWAKPFPEGFRNFIKDIGPKPHEQARLMLREFSIGYVPGNVFWSCPKPPVTANRHRI